MKQWLVDCLVVGHLALASVLHRETAILPRDSNVKVYVAVGDSFSSGPSAGDKVDKSDCRRHKKAHPPQLNETDEFSGAKFHFISCAGATRSAPKQRAS